MIPRTYTAINDRLPFSSRELIITYTCLENGCEGRRLAARKLEDASFMNYFSFLFYPRHDAMIGGTDQ